MHLMGYFTRVHPRFACFATLRTSVLRDWNQALVELSASEDADVKRQLQLAYEANALTVEEEEHILIPISLEKSVMPGTDSQGKKFNTPVITLRVPKHFVPAATMLMDVCVLADKPIENFIPYRLKREEPKTFEKVARSQAKWIDNHRNIPIRNVTR